MFQPNLFQSCLQCIHASRSHLQICVPLCSPSRSSLHVWQRRLDSLADARGEERRGDRQAQLHCACTPLHCCTHAATGRSAASTLLSCLHSPHSANSLMAHLQQRASASCSHRTSEREREREREERLSSDLGRIGSGDERLCASMRLCFTRFPLLSLAHSSEIAADHFAAALRGRRAAVSTSSLCRLPRCI